MYKCYLKRCVDFLLSSLGVILLSPLLLILCLAIKLDTKGPVFFCQKRVGKNKSLFTIYKFRTMRIDAPEEMPTHLLENPDYFITRVGKFLRKYSLDELPQLFNIIKGEMAIIGPRPALWNQSDLIEERDKYGANDIRPGLTGLAQISGRDELAIHIKASFDGHYAQHITVAMDMKCFLGTIVAVFKSSGVVEGSIGMVKIEGEKE
ncbi:sugar transferase [Enterococcus sp. DIV0756]|uniref:sugar transferase n=1 Tax=Enterococcus sp. DIV0756 TaxID=2774636 RepID=UPI003F21EB45